jgi:hypothetical protein
MFKTWYNFLKSSSNLVADTINVSELSVTDGCKLTDRINKVKEYKYIQVVPNTYEYKRQFK